MAIALAPGFGVGWVTVDPDADMPTADITIQPEQLIQGRLFDVQARPVQGVTVSVSSIEREVIDDLPVVFRRLQGLVYEWTRVNDMPGWPTPATTDTEGRFTIRGVGRRVKTGLSIIDPRFALQDVDVETDDAAGAKVVTAALEPPKILSGRVTDSGTGGPIPYARLIIVANSTIQRRNYRHTDCHADAGGRFRANVSPGEQFIILATPPQGRIYVESRKTVDWPKGAVEQSVDLALERGAAIRGTVVEESGGKPIAGALVSFVTLSRADIDRVGWRSTTETLADGTFELAAVPRTGHLAVQAPSDDYVLREIGVGEMAWGKPGGRRVYSNWVIACDPKLGGPGLDFHVALRRGITVTGHVIGPDAKPVAGTRIISRAVLDPRASWFLREWSGAYQLQAVRGRFELHGLDPDTELPVHFLEPKQKLGAVARLSGKSAFAGPLTVRLEPCGAAKARLIDTQGRAARRLR